MSILTYHPYSVAARLAIGLRARAALTAASDTVYEWRQRARQRRLLAQLNDRLLSDIGLSRSEVEREAAKPFWRV
jgi:uncharacterized protein YjiS (DUF1127 family)